MRKTLFPALLLVFLFTIGGAVSAQTSASGTDAPGIVVTKKRWSVTAGSNNVQGDPLKPGVNLIEEERLRKEIEDVTGRPATIVRVIRLGTPRRGANGIQFSFEVEVKNTGTRKIRELVWEYKLFDESRQLEVGFNPFANRVKIGPGKSAKLRAALVHYTDSVAESKKGTQEFRGPYLEQLIIHRIEYEDGSAWERPSN